MGLAHENPLYHSNIYTLLSFHGSVIPSSFFSPSSLLLFFPCNKWSFSDLFFGGRVKGAKIKGFVLIHGGSQSPEV